MLRLMYFEVYVNGERLGAYGHPGVENLTVSVSGSPEGSYVFAGAVCREADQRFRCEAGTPDTELVARKLYAYGAVQVPVYSNLSANQPSPHWTGTVGVSYAF